MVWLECRGKRKVGKYSVDAVLCFGWSVGGEKGTDNIVWMQFFGLARVSGEEKGRENILWTQFPGMGGVSGEEKGRYA